MVSGSDCLVHHCIATSQLEPLLTCLHSSRSWYLCPAFICFGLLPLAPLPGILALTGSLGGGFLSTYITPHCPLQVPEQGKPPTLSLSFSICIRGANTGPTTEWPQDTGLRAASEPLCGCAQSPVGGAGRAKASVAPAADTAVILLLARRQEAPGGRTEATLPPLGPGRCPYTTGSRAPREGADGRERSQGGAEHSRASLEGGRTKSVPAAHPLGAELALTCSCSRLLRACFCLSAKTASTTAFPSRPRHLREEAGPAAHLALPTSHPASGCGKLQTRPALASQVDPVWLLPTALTGWGNPGDLGAQPRLSLFPPTLHDHFRA